MSTILYLRQSISAWNAMISANATDTVITSFQHFILGWMQTLLNKSFDSNIQPLKGDKSKTWFDSDCSAAKNNNPVAKF